MAMREYLKTSVALILLVTLCLTIQAITTVLATRKLYYSEVCSSGTCHLDITAGSKRLPLDMKYHTGDVEAHEDDYSDFYRKHGDVPSPGIGH